MSTSSLNQQTQDFLANASEDRINSFAEYLSKNSEYDVTITRKTSGSGIDINIDTALKGDLDQEVKNAFKDFEIE